MALRSLVRFMPQSPACGPDCLKLRPARHRLFAAMLWTAASLPLAGCIPYEGDLGSFKLIEPAARPLAPGEKIAVTATDPEDNDDDAVACVRRRLGLLVAEGSVMEGAAFRSVPGIATAYSGPSDVSRLDDIAVDEALRARMADAGIRFLVEVDVSRARWAYSFSGGAEWYKQTGISAHVLDVASGEVSGPAMASVHGHGGSLLVIGVTPVTEGPACARVAAFLASSITGTPLSEIAPDLAPLAESERIREAAGLEGWLTACDAAVAGNAKEMSRVGFYFLNGNPPIGYDKIEAYTWFRRASEAGYRDAEAMVETMPTGFSAEERVAAEARVALEAPDGTWCRAVAGAS